MYDGRFMGAIYAVAIRGVRCKHANVGGVVYGGEFGAEKQEM